MYDIGFNSDEIRKGKGNRILLVKKLEGKNTWVVIELEKEKQYKLNYNVFY